MKKRIEEYSVGQLAGQTGVSIRTLHHYDEIGILKPAHVAANGYRLYRRDEVLRLQEILFCREIGMSLSEIGRLLGGPVVAFDRLISHRKTLIERARSAAHMLATLDKTIVHLKRQKNMTIRELYQPFSAEKQAEYEVR